MLDIRLTRKSFESIDLTNDYGTVYRIIGKEHLRAVARKKGINLYAEVCHKNQRKRKSFGLYGQISLKVFEQQGDEFLTQVKATYNPSCLNVTLDMLFENAYLPRIKRDNRTWRDSEQRYRKYIAPYLGKWKLPDIRSFHIEQALNESTKDLSDASFNRVRAVIHRMFAIAMRLDLISNNPCTSIPQKQENNIVTRTLTAAERPEFIKAALSQPDSLHHQSVLLALYTGARIGNIISIRKTDIAPDLSTLTFPVTKSGKSQTIPLSSAARDIIQRALSLSEPEQDFLFSSNQSKTGHIAYPLNAFTTICNQAKIAVRGGMGSVRDDFPKAPLTIHCLRKTFASTVLEQTGDIYCASTLLNHSSIEITRRYAFHQPAALSQVVENVGDVLSAR